MNNIKIQPLIFLLLSACAIFAQERYLEHVFLNIDKTTLTYADTLQLDFYSAKEDTLMERPLLILVHGGGFSSGKRDNPLEEKFSLGMAKMGYAVASISYRLTRKGKSFGCDCPAQDKWNTFLASTEDILRATQFLLDNATSLKFDPSKIVLVGSSAGAEGVLNTIFLKHHPDFRKLPYGTITYAGVISFAGAVLNSAYITHKTAVPTLLFHGKKDNLVPFGSAPHHYCNEASPGFLILDGSQIIADRLHGLEVPYTLVVDPNGNHDWANMAFGHVDLISRFLKMVVLDEKKVQSQITINTN